MSEFMSPKGRRSAMLRKMSSASGGGDAADGIATFWGIELTKEHAKEEWNFKMDEDTEEDKDDDKDDKDDVPDRDFMIHTLYVKMACLGKGAVKGEANIVQVETLDKDDNLIKIPIFNLVDGVNNTLLVNADFNDKNKVTFRLVEGTGPVYLSGSCLQEYPRDLFDPQDDSMCTETEASTATDDDVEEEEESEDMDDDDEDEEMDKKGKVVKGVLKRKTAPAKGAKAKRTKVEAKEESEEDSEDDEDFEDESEEEDASAKKKKAKAVPSPARGKAGKAKGPAAAKPAANKKKGKAK